MPERCNDSGQARRAKPLEIRRARVACTQLLGATRIILVHIFSSLLLEQFRKTFHECAGNRFQKCCVGRLWTIPSRVEPEVRTEQAKRGVTFAHDMMKLAAFRRVGCLNVQD
jgi:hypothetical protein